MAKKYRKTPTVGALDAAGVRKVATLVAELGSQQKAAEVLGVSVQAVSHFLVRNGVRATRGKPTGCILDSVGIADVLSTVKQLGSIKAAAKHYGVSWPSVSRYLAKHRSADGIFYLDGVATKADGRGAKLAHLSVAEVEAGIRQAGSQEAFGKLLGITQSAVSHFLRANRRSAPKAAAPTKPAGKRFVITSAVNATPAHTGFLGALKRYCEHNGAELHVIPLRYKNPTSLWTQEQENDDWWSPELVPHLLSARTKLSDALVVLADIRTQPTASNPLQGFETITGGASAILGHPQIALTTVPTPQHKLPKILTTTGAVTVANYSETKAGARGHFHHSLGAVVVELEDCGTFHLRHITAEDDGSFEDLDKHYTLDSVRPNGGVAALVMGDSHIDFIDQDVVDATFVGAGSMVSVLKPEHLVWHDVLDCYSVSHHHLHDPIINFTKHHSGRNDIRAEVERVFEFIDRHSPQSVKNVFVPSNHVDHFAQWVKSTDPRKDPQNAVIWAEVYHAMCTHAKMGRGGAQTIDPFEYLAKCGYLGCADRSIFIQRGASFTVCGIELGMHGDRGPNGSRGNRKVLDRIGVKSIVGHSHSPGISGGVYQVGTSSIYDMEYAVGSPSSWLHTHCVVYKNGKRALLNIIGRKWRLASSK